MDLDWLAEFAVAYLAAWNSHEPDRLFALMTSDIVYDDVAWPTQMRGVAEIRPFLASLWRAVPDLRFEIREGPYVVPGEPKAAFHWRGWATFSGPLDPPGFAPTGARAQFEGVDFHEYRDDKLARLRIDYDLMDFSRRVGLLPARIARRARHGGRAAAGRARSPLTEAVSEPGLAVGRRLERVRPSARARRLPRSLRTGLSRDRPAGGSASAVPRRR